MSTRLIQVQALSYLGTSLASVFFNVLLFRQGGTSAVVLYAMVTILVQVAAFHAGGVWLQRRPARVLMQAGVLLQALMYGVAVALGPSACSHLFGLGTLNGLAQGAWWCGNNLMQFVVTQERTRNVWFGRQGLFNNGAQALGPMLGGAIISGSGWLGDRLLGYHLVLLSVALVMAANAWLMQTLPDHEPQRSVGPDPHRSKGWWLVLGQWFVFGLSDIVFGALSGILLITILREELSLGLVTTLQTILAGASAVYIGRLLQHRPEAFFVGMVLWPLGLLAFAALPNGFGVAVMVGLVGLSSAFLTIPVSKGLYDELERAPRGTQAALLIERETVLGAARVLSCALVLWACPSADAARTVAWLAPAMPVALGFLQLCRQPLQLGKLGQLVPTK